MKRHMPVEGRNDTIRSLFKEGVSVKELSRQFKITHQRIYALLNPPRPIPKIILGKRITCFVCRARLAPTDNKYCRECVATNNLRKGRDLTRGLVRGRDDNTCQSCGAAWKGTGKRFDVHHLDGKCGKLSTGYDPISTLHTMITVCHKCHFNLDEHAGFGTGKVIKNGSLKGKTKAITSLRNRGLTFGKIGKKFGVSSAAIQYHLHPRNQSTVREPDGKVGASLSQSGAAAPVTPV